MERKSIADSRLSRAEGDEARLRRFSTRYTGIPKEHISVWQEPNSSEDDDENFSVESCWETLLNLPSCMKVMIKEKYQKMLNIQVGVNVSQEFPWKQIKFKHIQEYLFDNVASKSNQMLYSAFQNYQPDYTVLVGYAPVVTQNEEHVPDGDPFIFFPSTEDARTAMAIIKNIESYERWKFNKRIVKKPRVWVSLKSENEVDLTLQQRQVVDLKTEIQSIYPTTLCSAKSFTFRKSGDVRDGYVELVPGESENFDNVTKRRVNVGIQSSAKRVDLDQQTDPSFPTNAWAQYLYEFKEGDEGLDESSDEEEKEKEKPNKAATPEPPKPKPPPEVSDHIKFLLSTLEFNQVDMYRNDYPLISDKQVEHYSNPYLEESLCYVNISKSYGRFVSGTDWYPTISGLIVTSYTHDTISTIEHVSHRVDTVRRAVLQPNPILMWSFSDNLNFKLEFESPLEVTFLSFCPFKPHHLFGGTKNGQILIWDLLDRPEKMDLHEIRTAAQAKYHEMIQDFLKWTIPIDEDSTVPPAYITSLEHSQKAAITGIYWMGRQFFINNFGKVYKDPEENARHKCFITSSLDGTLVFWNLDAITTKRVQGVGASKTQPKELTQSESPYKNKTMKPVYTVVFSEPITSIVGDTSVFSFQVRDTLKSRRNHVNFGIELVANDPFNMRSSVITSSLYGRLERLTWLGLYSDADGREMITSSVNFARVHDGPVVAMRKNPFYPGIFASIGRNVLAVWKEDYNYSPIFWRKRPCDLTALSWSEDRPGVLFLTRIDGSLEAWDILARDDDACLSDILGGGIVTAISEHRPSEPEKLLGIGDYNSSFRMIKLPRSFYVPADNELEHFQEYISREETRKKSIQAWEQTYYEKNRDIIEAKRQAESDARKEMERIEKETALNAARKALEDLEATRRANQPQHTNYTEKMKQKWDELNLNRLLTILMSRKRVDAEQLESDTALEKERLRYEAAKKATLMLSLQRTADELAAVRARILPSEKPDQQRHDMIAAIVDNVMQKNVEPFDEVEEEANHIIDSFDTFRNIDYIEFLQRGEHRRSNLSKLLGGNTERLYWYTQMKNENLLGDCDWGFTQFMNANIELQQRQQELEDTQETEYSDHSTASTLVDADENAGENDEEVAQ